MTDQGLGWSDERVELLKRLWGEGLSASQIAAKIGGVSRNAVIGKVHRLGLAGRTTPAAPATTAATPRPKPKVARAPSPPAPIAPIAKPRVVEPEAPANDVAEPEMEEVRVDDVAIAVSERVTIMDLRESMCRWPIGDPASADFRFCGSRSVTGLPYCAAHCQVAYQQATDRRRDRPRLAIRA